MAACTIGNQHEIKLTLKGLICGLPNYVYTLTGFLKFMYLMRHAPLNVLRIFTDFGCEDMTERGTVNAESI